MSTSPALKRQRRGDSDALIPTKGEKKWTKNLGQSHIMKQSSYEYKTTRSGLKRGNVPSSPPPASMITRKRHIKAEYIKALLPKMRTTFGEKFLYSGIDFVVFSSMNDVEWLNIQRTIEDWIDILETDPFEHIETPIRSLPDGRPYDEICIYFTSRHFKGIADSLVGMTPVFNKRGLKLTYSRVVHGFNKGEVLLEDFTKQLEEYWKNTNFFVYDIEDISTYDYLSSHFSREYGVIRYHHPSDRLWVATEKSRDDFFYICLTNCYCITTLSTEVKVDNVTEEDIIKWLSTISPRDFGHQMIVFLEYDQETRYMSIECHAESPDKIEDMVEQIIYLLIDKETEWLAEREPRVNQDFEKIELEKQAFEHQWIEEHPDHTSSRGPCDVICGDEDRLLVRYCECNTLVCVHCLSHLTNCPICRREIHS